VFDLKKGRHAKAAESAKDARISKLEAVVAQKDAKIAQKNEVISYGSHLILARYPSRGTNGADLCPTE